MIKHKKYRILGVTFILLLVLSVGILYPTYAQNGSEDLPEESTNLTCDDLAEKYGVYISPGDKEGEFSLIRDTMYADSCAGADKTTNKPDLKIIQINGVNQPGTQIINKKVNEIKFNAVFLHSPSTKEEYISVVLEVVGKPDPNNKYQYERVEVLYSATIEPAIPGNLPMEPNVHYNGICKPLRDRITKLPENSEERIFYESVVSYCFEPTVLKGTNYTEDEIKSKISGANASWKASQASNETQSSEWEDNFNTLMEYAKSKKAQGHYLENPSKMPDFSAKCRYDYIKKNGAKYTNDYKSGKNLDTPHPLIDADIDYYLNKDYYYASKTTTTVKEDIYKYNYAPGRTSVGGKATCTRKCEEAVKVEYGPPIASKAGLCFEYKVKITSYVKCGTTFNAEKPKKDTGYCNPPPRCVSTAGVERKKPQAGPTEDFDACISNCDGGKYTQACSKKCYAEVYGEQNGAQKLAINYEDVQARALANNNDYSVDQCLKDNANYYGCYVYNNGKIEWKRADKSTNFAYTIDKLGRWYIEAHAKGYDLSQLGKGVGRYVADGIGFYRKIYNSGPCTDNCNWQNTCDENVYLNPGTAIKDYQDNLVSYESARKECEAKTTCSSRKTDLTISINYDTNEKDGKTVKRVKTKIEYPLKNQKETIQSKKSEHKIDKVFDNKSTLLDIDGCYVDSNKKNWYRSEWSFPGTYIHNKTGEISFGLPDDISGWYYEDKKFCMPLNALSVNSKWWEWNVISGGDFNKSCYTRQDIEDELATKDNTSNGYNINATATNFGYFGWNFNIDCFYGLRNEVCSVDDEATKKCCSKQTPACTTDGSCNNKRKTGLDYTVRTVDRSNLFPNAPGEGIVSNDTRPIGFNWTNAALNDKNSAYLVNPKELIEDIQSNAKQLYSDEDTYLDYQFELSPATLRKIREYNKKYPYGTWNGKTVEGNGINYYLSNLWNGSSSSIERNINLREVAGAVIKTGTPGKNNE